MVTVGLKKMVIVIGNTINLKNFLLCLARVKLVPKFMHLFYAHFMVLMAFL